MPIDQIIHVKDRFQENYHYTLSAEAGQDFAPEFRPYYSPSKMLELGIFEGKYCNDCQDEFPPEWYEKAKLSDTADPSINYFGIKSRQPLDVWQQKGWIIAPDPRGWFQWYCRYYLGRRLPGVDTHQIKRWKAFARHAGQIKANCHPGDIFCRPKQRQALLQWSYDPLI
ncbi:hypothetical protein [Kiloniella antarctica]|uniref:Uncharacterized protein n=1 Tax=Kiloniella antarctica TaxID=1550907 RepID=A0ABW5BHK8_9PROT